MNSYPGFHILETKILWYVSFLSFCYVCRCVTNSSYVVVSQKNIKYDDKLASMCHRHAEIKEC